MTQDNSETAQKSPTPTFGASGRKIVYDKDGKPCRACNSLLDFQVASGKVPTAPKKKPENTRAYGKDEPADVETLGRSSWTLLHSIAATYPENPTDKNQADMKQFVSLFGQFYPCWFCAEDFQSYIASNEPDTQSQDAFGMWLCGAHNNVNKKLGKPAFDCNLWKQRWKDGWDN